MARGNPPVVGPPSTTLHSVLARTPMPSAVYYRPHEKLFTIAIYHLPHYPLATVYSRLTRPSNVTTVKSQSQSPTACKGHRKQPSPNYANAAFCNYVIEGYRHSPPFNAHPPRPSCPLRPRSIVSHRPPWPSWTPQKRHLISAGLTGSPDLISTG